ncbi:MAG: FKBP-type peptidyl-prolyl cis-trans isomerase [Phycisphaerae bacterium]|nr:FKBP-type peptidyl-prolyl cis-trans isomerase [Phycisphaerae bacterium]
MKTLVLSVVIAAFTMITCNVQAQATEGDQKTVTTQPTTQSAFANEKDQVSYALGFQIGNDLKSNNIDINVDVFAKAIKDVMGDKKLAMSQEEIITALTNFQQKMRAQAEANLKEMGEKNLAEAKAFLETNAKKEGVKTLPSGLQYKVIKSGTGETPQATDKVKVNYVGKFLNGQEFDSSYKRGEPAEFNADQVIPGWTEALTMMKEGDKWELYIPPSLGYGEMGRGPIPPNSLLIFEVELLDVDDNDDDINDDDINNDDDVHDDKD